MTTAIVPVNAYGASLSIPADGEAVSSASVLLYMQEVANRLEFLRQRLPGANPVANILNIGRFAADAIILPSSTVWARSFSNVFAPVVNNLVLSSTEVFLMPIPLVAGTVIRNFAAIARGAGAHAGLPAVMPKVELVKLDGLGYLGAAVAPSYTSVDNQSDTSGTTAAYQVAHLITKTLGAPQTVGVNEAWALRMTGESGANALIGLQWTGFSIGVSA